MDNSDNEPPEKLGSYIVGCTIVQDDIDKYYNQYPVLIDIAELGANLEINNVESTDEVLTKIKSLLVELGNALSS